MAVLKDLIVHGASRFLSKSYFDSLEADSGAFKKIIAKDATVTNATVMGLLDVTGELHTKSWSNSNIATIDGSFYITPTFGLQGGDTSTNTVTVAANSLSFTNSSGTNFNFDSLYLDGSDSAIAWTTSSKVIVTGEILKDGEWIPLGTLKGTLGTYSTTSVVINNITDAKGAAPATLAALVGSGLRYRNVKVSLISINRSGLKPLGIFMTATGANGRTFLDIYGGNNAESSTYAGLSTPVLRIGNLKGLPSITLPDNSTVTPNGWGIYTTNGFFTGTIVSTKGKIGNFTLDTALHAGTNGGPTSVSGTTAGTYVGTDGFLNYASNTAYVKMTGGVITAVGAVIKGTITADSGTIGGITANSSYGLYTNSKTSTTSSNTGFLIHKDGAIYLGAYDSTSGVTSCPFQVTAAGSLTARSGRIGKFNLTNTYLYTGSGSTMAGMGGDQAFWAGNSNSSSAPFHVSYAGVLSATGATISGTLTAGADSSIGPWTVTATSIYKGNATHGTSGSGNMYFGNSGLSISDTFLVDNAGNLSATGAVFKNVTLKDGSNNTRASIDGNGLIVYDGVGADTSNIVSQFTSTGVTIGKTGATHVDIKSNSLEITDMIGGITFFKVRDAVNESGQVVDTFSGDGEKTEFTLNYTAANTSYTVTQNGTTVSPNKTTTKITFSTAPAVGDQIVITYNVTGNSAKGYDFGIRKSNTITGIYSVIEGYNTTASGKYSHADGYNTTASGKYSHAEGSETEASGSASHAEGSQTVASGSSSHAEGSQTVASGSSSHADGYNTTASGKYSHAEGIRTEASGYYSHAEGSETEASGSTSHAEGSDTTASGLMSHAEGGLTVASGTASHAGGWETEANGKQSFAHGYQVQADFNQEFVIGRFNNTSLTPYINTIYMCDENDYNKATLTFPNSYGNYQSDFYITYNGSFPPSSQCVNVTSSTITIVAASFSSDGNGHFEDGDEVGVILDSDLPQFMLGNGDTTHESNALTIRRNGDVYANGNVYVNCSADSSGTAHIGQIFNWQGNLKSNLTANAGAYVEGNGSITLKGGHTYLVLAYVAMTNSTNGTVDRRAQIFNKTTDTAVLTGDKFVASQAWGTVETQTIYEAGADVTLTVRGSASRPTTTIPTAWIRAVCIA